MRLRALPKLASFVLTLCAVLPAAAVDLGPFHWDPIETVDTGDIALSSAAGRSVAGIADGSAQNWDIVFLKGGKVYHCARSDEAWGAPEQLSPEGVTARNPQIARVYGTLLVVWEADDAGVPEIWGRMWYEGGGWSPTECLTCDGNASTAPSLDGDRIAILAWEEGGLPVIYGRIWSGSWGPAQAISPPDLWATDPTASTYASAFPPYEPYASVAWSDRRTSEPEIYVRRWDGNWQAEERLTDLPGACTDPSLHAEACCIDWVIGSNRVLFLNDSGGVPEVWDAFQGEWQSVTQLSREDAIPARRAVIAGFMYDRVPLYPFGGPTPVYAFAWTEGIGNGPGRLILGTGTPTDPPDTLSFSTSVTGGPIVGGVDGSPTAGALVLWTEGPSGARVLRACRGTSPGCSIEEFSAPASLLIAPEGFPADTMRIWDTCSQEFIRRYYEEQIVFDSALDSDLTWDPLQPHPQTEWVLPDPQGRWIFSIRGGGCSQAGYARIRIGPLYVWGWLGVRSPDVDGDCVVNDADLTYVQGHLGSADFCADLDGSGVVDAADVAIVQATQGDHCSHITGVDGTASSTRPLALTVSPNPAMGRAAIRLELPAEARLRLEVLDAAGRVVRTLGDGPVPAGASSVIWDGDTNGGHPAPAGVYFVLARMGEQAFRRSLILVR